MNEKIIQALRCPKSGGQLVYRRATENQPEGLYSADAQLLYPIRDGIPVMLIEQAIAVNSD